MSRAVKICAQCGAQFTKDPRNTWAYWERARYCSSVCAGKANSDRSKSMRPDRRTAFSKWVSPTSDGCWPWLGGRDKDGYGVFNYARKSYRAPIVALELDGRPVPVGMYACHHCDNPSCVRPDHLYVGTPAQNCADAKRRGRINLGSRSKLTPDDVRAIRSAYGSHQNIADAFGVSRTTVTLIRGRKTWVDVQ